MVNPDKTSIEIEAFDFHVLPMETRFPFKYGIASMTHLPHLIVRVKMVVGGKESVGIASEGLPPKWFTKNLDTTFEEDLPWMLKAIEYAASEVSGLQAPSFFDLWLGIQERQKQWGRDTGEPPLLAGLGSSLVERAILDGFCRGVGIPFSQVVRDNLLGIRVGELDESLGDVEPVSLLPEKALTKIQVRHTVGLGDPLTDADIAEPLNDGLPHSLEASIRQYGLSYFKIKLCGDLEMDRERLANIRSVLDAETGGEYRITLDGNEQFRDVGSFRECWDELRGDERVRPLFDHLIFVEQPLHRDQALDESVRVTLEGWESAPPIIIDESDAEIGSFPRAFSLGYSGTSHKNCKGVVKGILNAMRIEKLRRAEPYRKFILSGEDLVNVGPVALLQDLAVMATLGIEHVERNGHHYFLGLSAWPQSVQDQVIECHPGLYRRDEHSFPVLRINEGELHIKSVIEAPFGTEFLLDADLFSTLEEWKAKS
ncbi:MAG: hypothetical protein CMO55_27715 [Verrucomicrobiales bacterium]|nr:hypothetical protein [Verrucomicrobiales bacterium]